MDTLDDDPMTAAAIFEKAAPDLDQPVALGLEPGPPYHIARWAIRTQRDAYRMKLAVDTNARADLMRGARVSRVLRSRGLAVPEVHAVHRVLDRIELTVVVERRLGTTDAFSSWPALGPPVAEDTVKGYPGGTPPPPRLAERMDLYFGADLVRGVVWAPEDAPPHIIERFHAALDAWGRGKAALMT